LHKFGYEGQLEMDFEQKIFSLVEEAQANYDTELSILQRLIRQAKDCLDTETDAKVEYLLEKLTELKRIEDNPDLKFLIFTEFTYTQAMLKKVLEERGGYLCEAINGSMEFNNRSINSSSVFSPFAVFFSLNQIFINVVIDMHSANNQISFIIILIRFNTYTSFTTTKSIRHQLVFHKQFNFLFAFLAIAFKNFMVITIAEVKKVS
jgi:hypothetical protein